MAAVDTVNLYIPAEIRKRSNALLTYEGIETAANYNGYYLSPLGLSNFYGNAFQVMDTEIKLETNSSYSRNKQQKLIHIRTQPDKMGLWNDTRIALQALDMYAPNGAAISNGIFSHAELQRVDYTIDIPYPLQFVMSSLIVNKRSTITALQDMVDIEEAHIEREYNGAGISSFRIGKDDKYLRIYDLVKKRGLKNNGENVHITRIELSLNSKGAIRKLMNSNPLLSNKYQGKLKELDSHFRDIAEGITNPFQGVLLSNIKIPTFSEKFPSYPNIFPSEEDLEAYYALKKSIQQGFLINEIRRLNQDGNFLRTHHRYFDIHAWKREFQLTAMYREEMKKFLGIEAVKALTYPADTSILFLPSVQPILRWPMELTQ